MGSPINFRGLVYSPINEQGVVYLFGLIAEDLNIRVESIQQGYPDCTGIQYLGKGRWERVRIEFEYNSSDFNHDPQGCDILVCWEDDLNESKKEELKESGIEIIELKSIINTPEIPSKVLRDPEEKTSEEFDLEYHYKRTNVDKAARDLFERVDKGIKGISKEIWVKYSKTAITYYSPKKMFVFLRLQKTGIRIDLFTNQTKLEGIDNIKNHENWGSGRIGNEDELKIILGSIKKSYEIMKKAEEDGINTGWYALTPDELDAEKEEEPSETEPW